MPELPEVETIRRVLSRTLPGRRIQSVTRIKKKLLRGQSATLFIRRLLHQKIEQVDRRGKFLLIRLSSSTLLMHLGMSGQVLVVSQPVPPCLRLRKLPDKHTHLVLKLSGGVQVFFRDPRMFGRLQVLDLVQEQKLIGGLGPEPLSPHFTLASLRHALALRCAGIKSLLLNQQLIAGLGNIYTDEALFRAGILPTTPANHLTTYQIRRLHTAIRSVLQDALHCQGTTIADFRDPQSRPGTFQQHLNVYGRTGEPCYKCHSIIMKSWISQRGTHWCPKCQK